MPSGLLTGGWLSPIGGGVVSGGPSGVVCAFELRDTDGVLQAGVSLSGAGEVRVSTDGGVTFNNRAGAAPISSEHGIYTYTLDNTEAAFNYVLVQINKTGYGLVLERVNVTDAQLAAAVISIQNSITTATDATTAAILSAQNHIETHVDGTISSAVTSINAHTDAEATAIEGHVDASISSSQTAVTSAITAAVTAIDAHTDSAIAPVAANVVSIFEDTEEIIGLQQETLGLLHKNGKVDRCTYVNGFLTSFRLRVFANYAAWLAATGDNPADGAEGEVMRFVGLGTDVGDGTLKTFSLAQVYP